MMHDASHYMCTQLLHDIHLFNNIACAYCHFYHLLCKCVCVCVSLSLYSLAPMFTGNTFCM